MEQFATLPLMVQPVLTLRRVGLAVRFGHGAPIATVPAGARTNCAPMKTIVRGTVGILPEASALRVENKRGITIGV